MADIATRWQIDAGDWSLSAPEQLHWTDETGRSILDQAGRPVSSLFTAGQGLAIGDDLFTAVVISLFTDAAPDTDDIGTISGADPRGWWAGAIGSTIWLRARSRATPAVLALVKADIEAALAWMVADQVVARIDVSTELIRPGVLGAMVLLLRADGVRRALRFSRLWENS